MMISATGISPAQTLPDPSRAALQGFTEAQAVVAAAVESVGAGTADPAVILDVGQAQVTAGIAAAVMKADQQNFQRLLDVLA